MAEKQKFKEKLAENMSRLRSLHAQRQEARVLNHAEVVQEAQRMKLPSNHLAKQKQATWLLEDERRRQEAVSAGKDYAREQLLHVSAADAESLARKKHAKRCPDAGFSDFEAASIRQHQRLIRGLPPKDMQHYEEEKARIGVDAFYGGKGAIVHGLHVDRKQAIDGMVADLEKQAHKRDKYSRRRTHNDDADIDYINERNKQFNRKLEQFYGEYTGEIKQNLERGTAV